MLWYTPYQGIYYIQGKYYKTIYSRIHVPCSGEVSFQEKCKRTRHSASGAGKTPTGRFTPGNRFEGNT